MGAWLDLAFDFIDEPARAAAAARARRPVAAAVAAVLLAAVSLFLAQAVSVSFLPVSSGPFSFVFICAWRVIGTFLLAGVLHLTVEVVARRGFGAHHADPPSRGQAAGLFVLLGLSDLAWTLALPGVLILKALGLDNWLTVWLLIGALGTLSIRYMARSVRENYGLSSPMAWTIVSLPYIGLAVLGAGFFALAVGGVVVSMLKMFS